MKPFISILCSLLLSAGTLQAQEKGFKQAPTFRSVEQAAQPKYDLVAYIREHMIYPPDAQKNNIEGEVTVRFIVNEDGSVSNTEIIRGKELGYGIPEEAISVFNSLPKWWPTMQNGKVVSAYYVVSVNFSQNNTGIQLGEIETFQCGGDVASPPYDIKKYIKEQLRYPKAAQQVNIEGRVYISFIVNRDGTLSDFEVRKGKELGYGLPEEALRVVRSMPKWKPAMQDGEAVKSYYTLPVPFILE